MLENPCTGIWSQLYVQPPGGGTRDSPSGASEIQLQADP